MEPWSWFLAGMATSFFLLDALMVAAVVCIIVAFRRLADRYEKERKGGG